MVWTTNNLMVWVAIFNRGISKPLFRPSKSEPVNSNIYIIEYIYSFFSSVNSDSNFIFWLDLTRCHYSKQTIAWMDENVKFVPKEIDPPNVPQARPIEIFWVCLTQKVYEGG